MNFVTMVLEDLKFCIHKFHRGFFPRGKNYLYDL